MKILCVQNIECESLGTLKKLLLSDGFKIDTINAQTEVIAINLDRYGGIIILGGPMAVYDNLPFLLQEQSLIKSAISKNLPTLGICLGSQLIAQAAGGRVYKGEKKEIGWHEVSLTPAGRKDIFKGINSGKKPKVFQWHGDTYDLPSGAQVLAKTDLYPQAFRVGSAIGIQFHFEVTKEMIELWMEEYREEIRSEDLKPEAILPMSGDIENLTTMCAQVYRNFSMSLKANK